MYSSVGCPIHEVGVFRGILDPERYRRAVRVVREFKPHIIHGAVYEGLALAAVAGRIGGVPIIVGEETSDPRNRSWRGSLLYRALAGMTHHMVGVSPAVTEYLTARIHLPRSKVTLISNGVAEAPLPTAERVSELRRALALSEGDFVIGTVGRLFDGTKRISDLLRALTVLIGEFPSARLLIVGGGPDEQPLRQLAVDLGVRDHVRFAGYQPNPRPYYALMDVFALASAREAFGLVLVEAMLARLPVVATRVGGIPSVVVDGETGVLVDPLNPRALVDAIVALGRDPELRRSMGDKGRARAVAVFGAERYVRDIDQLYRRLVSERLAA
jgi:glycosyltransferase involved in cell wall biosynthesis